MTLDALIAKVEALTGPDRETDALIYIALEYPDWRLQVSCSLFPEQVQAGRIQEPEETNSVNRGEGWRESPKFTASLDAIVKLVEAKLKSDDIAAGGWWEVDRNGDALVVMAIKYGPDEEGRFEYDTESVTAHAATPALALCLALLRALKAQEHGKG